MDGWEALDASQEKRALGKRSPRSDRAVLGAAARVELVLPGTRVCGGAGLFDDLAGAAGACETDAGAGCCGPAAAGSVPVLIGIGTR